MARLPIKREVFRRLFALSGNQCANPNCDHELITANGKYVAEICHIEAANDGGARYNRLQSDEHRRSFENLVLLCHKHHIESDDYDAATLLKIKADHEQKFKGKENYLSEALEEKIANQINEKLDLLINKADQQINISVEIRDILLTSNRQGIQDTGMVNDSAIYAQQLEFIKDLKKQGNFRTALKMLMHYKEENWGKLTPELQFKTIANIGILHLNLHNKKEAIEWMLRLDSIAHNHPDRYAYLSLCYGLQNDKERFTEVFNKALALQAENSNLWLGYIYIHEHTMDLNELLKAIPEVQLQKSEIIFTIAHIYYKNGRSAEGKIFLEKACELEKNSPLFLADIKAFMATKCLPELVTMFKVFQKQYSAEEMQEIETAHKYFTDSWDTFKHTEMGAVRSYVLINRGVLNQIMQRISEATSDFKEAYYLTREYLPFKNLMLNYLLAKKTSDASKLMAEHLQSNAPLTLEQEVETITLQSRLLIIEQKISEGIATLETLLDDKYALFRRRTLLTLAHICIETDTFDKIKEYAALLQKELPDDLEALLIHAHLLITESKAQEAVSMLDAAAALVTVRTEPQTILEIATEYIQLKEFEKALKLLSNIVDLDIYNDVTKGFIFSHFQMGNYAVALKFAEPLFALYPSSSFLAETIMKSHTATGNFDKSIQAGEIYITQPASLKKDTFRFQVAMLLSRQKQTKKLLKLLLEIEDHDQIRKEELFQIAYWLGTSGEVQKGLDLAFFARNKFYDDSNAHLSYFQVLTSIKRPQKELFPTVIGPTNGVDLEDEDKNIEHYLISNENIRGENIIKSDHVLARALIGAKKGQDISFDKGFGLQKRYKIKNILNKHTYAFQETSRLFQTRFIGQEHVTVMKIDPKNPFAELEQMLRNHSVDKTRFEKEAFENHQRRMLPLGSIAIMEQANFVKQWCNWIHHPNFYQVAFLGNNAQILSSALAQKKPVVLDLTVLLLAVYVLKSYRLFELLGLPLFVSQATLDEIQQFYEELGQYAKEGRKAFNYENGGVVTLNISGEDIQGHQQKILGLLDWCRQNTTIAAPTKAGTEWKHRGERTMILGKHTYDTTLLAEEINGTVYSDDAVVVVELLKYNNINGFSTTDVVTEFFSQRQITKEESDYYYHQMIAAGYISLPGSAEQIWSNFNKAEFQIKKPFTTATKSIFILLPNLAAQVTGKFLKSLYTEITVDPIRVQVTLFMFKEISNRKDQQEVFRKLRIVLAGEFQLLPVQLGQVLDLLDSFSS